MVLWEDEDGDKDGSDREPGQRSTGNRDVRAYSVFIVAGFALLVWGIVGYEASWAHMGEIDRYRNDVTRMGRDAPELRWVWLHIRQAQLAQVVILTAGSALGLAGIFFWWPYSRRLRDWRRWLVTRLRLSPRQYRGE